MQTKEENKMRNAKLKQDLIDQASKQTGFYPVVMEVVVGIFGKPGSGKTLFLKDLICDLIAQNSKIFIFDISSGWRHFNKSFNGEQIRFDNKNSTVTKQKIFKNTITVFEIEELRHFPSLLKISLERLLTQIMEQMSKNSEPFVIVIDDLYLLEGAIDSSLEKILNEIRKYNGRLVFSTDSKSELARELLKTYSREIDFSETPYYPRPIMPKSRFRDKEGE